LLQPIKDLTVLRRHTMGCPLHPISVVLPGDALLDRQPHDLVHGAALALGLPPQLDAPLREYLTMAARALVNQPG
jgi:hypothetical protein